jgi:hypothetical protein
VSGYRTKLEVFPRSRDPTEGLAAAVLDALAAQQGRTVQRQRLVFLRATPEQARPEEFKKRSPSPESAESVLAVATSNRHRLSRRDRWLVTADGGEIGEEDKLQKPVQASVAGPGR